MTLLFIFISAAAVACPVLCAWLLFQLHDPFYRFVMQRVVFAAFAHYHKGVWTENETYWVLVDPSDRLSPRSRCHGGVGKLPLRRRAERLTKEPGKRFQLHHDDDVIPPLIPA